MNHPRFGFYFEAAGRAAAHGAIDPAEQFFEGSLAEVSLARETGQNSIDAAIGYGPVIMEFELATVSTDSIPGIEDLRLHMGQVVQDTKDTQGHDRMKLAYETAHLDSVPVLRIGDYGTGGLSGSESVNDHQSPLSALTRGAGISANDGTRGGSFGIGSAVGPMASDLCTVLYSSLPHGSQDVVFAGHSRLASHRDTNGEWLMGDGFYTDLDSSDFHYQRNRPALPPFGPRTEPGTDVYVLAYRKAEQDPELLEIRKAFLENFLMSIHRGRLVVRAVTEAGTWQLDQQSLESYAREFPEVAAFYAAIKDPAPIEKSTKRFGMLRLYVNVDETLEKTLHTVTLRKPLMKIDTFRHTSIPARYAAVLECADDIGNTYLRQLEPPQHNHWDAGRAPDGVAAIRELKTFVREGLKSRIKEQLGDQVEIKGLERYLPAEIHGAGPPQTTAAGRPINGEGSDKEASTVQGGTAPTLATINPGKKSVRIGVRTQADSDGDSKAEKGKDQGGEGSRDGNEAGLPGTGESGEGNSRIRRGDVRFRSWSDATDGSVVLALTSKEDITGDLELVPLGPGGSVEDGYTLPISNATLTVNNHSTGVTYADNVLSGLSLQAGVTSQVRLTLSSTDRYRLGIK